MTSKPPTFSEIEQEQQAKKESIEPYVGYLIEELEEVTAKEVIYDLFYIEAIYYRNTGNRLTDVTWKRKYEEDHHSNPLGAIVTAPLLEESLNRILESNIHDKDSVDDNDRVLVGVPNTFETSFPRDVDTLMIKELVEEIEDKTVKEMLEWCETHPLTHSDAEPGEDLYFTTMVGDPNAGTPDIYNR